MLDAADTIGVGIVDVVAITPDRDAVVSVQSSGLSRPRNGSRHPVTIFVGNDVAMTFDATVAAQK
jgi:hypothetical protein